MFVRTGTNVYFRQGIFSRPSKIKFSRTLMARIPMGQRKYFRDSVFKIMSVNHSARPEGITGVSFRFSLT